MNLKEVEKVVGSIQSQLFKNSNSISVGMLKSHFRGAGIQFKEHQVYTPGDDVRFIDWKLSAKTNSTFIKTFEEERNVEIHVLLDVSNSMLMGFRGVSKLQASIEIICLLYLLAEKTKDKVSVIISTDTDLILPLTCGHAGIALFISKLQGLKILLNDGKINLLYRVRGEKSERRMSLLKNLVAKNKQVILLSDLSQITEKEALEKLLYRSNLHCFLIQSPLDEAHSLPFSIYGDDLGRGKFIKVNSLELPIELKGRYKKISVKDRYLEKFVRDML